MAGEREVRNLEDSQRVVRKGQPLGFRVGEDGALVAVAGAEEIPLPLRPTDVRKVVWHCRTEDSSQFAKELSKAGQGAVVVGATAGYLTGAAALGIGTAILESESDNECEEERASKHHKHHKHRHHRHRDKRKEPEPEPRQGETTVAPGPGK
jgi:hypothetical protein